MCVIYQKCALNIAHHAYFTRKTVRPRRLMVSPTTPTQPNFFPCSSDFRRVAPSPLFTTRQACGPCSLTRGGGGLRFLELLFRQFTKCLNLKQCIMQTSCVPIYKCTPSQMYAVARTQCFVSRAHNHSESNKRWVQRF